MFYEHMQHTNGRKERDFLNINLEYFKCWQLLQESTICNDYLDEIYPNNPLNPTDPYDKANQRILFQRWDSKVNVSNTSF